MKRSKLAKLLKQATPLALVGILAATGIAAAQSTTYKLGVTFPLTGLAASEGATMTKAVNLAVKEINKSGELGQGAQIKAFFYDSQAKPDVGVRAIEQAISVENISYILTGYSGVSLAQAPVAERNKRVLVNVGGASPALSGISPWFFNAIPLTHLQVPVLVHYLIDEKGKKNWALIYRDDDLGRGLNQALPAAVKAFGGKMGPSESYLPGSSNFRLQLVRIRAANPDVVYIGGVSTEIGAIIAQGASLGLKPIWTSYGAYNHASTVQLGGAAAEGGYYTNPSNFGPDLKPFPAYAKMQKDWKAAYGDTRDLDYVAAQFYMGVHLYADIIKSLKDEGKEITAKNIRDMLEKTTFKNTVTGGMSFDKERNAITSIGIFQLKGGKFVPVTVYTADQVRELDAKIGKK